MDVGGYKFSTTETTLNQVKDTYFTNQVLNQDLGKVIFIDRPGKYFSFILNYLRIVNTPNANVSLVNSLTLLENTQKLGLSMEAEFYRVILYNYLLCLYINHLLCIVIWLTRNIRIPWIWN